MKPASPRSMPSPRAFMPSGSCPACSRPASSSVRPTRVLRGAVRPLTGGSIPPCSKTRLPKIPKIASRAEGPTRCCHSIVARSQDDVPETTRIQALVGRYSPERKRAQDRFRKYRNDRKSRRVVANVHTSPAPSRLVHRSRPSPGSTGPAEIAQKRKFKKPCKNGHRTSVRSGLRQWRELRKRASSPMQPEAQPEVQELPEPRKTSTGRASDGSRLFMQKPAETLFEP